MATKRLIEFVKKHPCLYDDKDPDYKNRAYKRKLWECIGLDIYETADVARKKWKTLRDNFGRHKKEVANPTLKSRFLKWVWANDLQFLDGAMQTNVDKDAAQSSSKLETATTNDRKSPPSQCAVSMQEDTINTSIVSLDSDSEESETSLSELKTDPEKNIPVKRAKTEITEEKTKDIDAVDHLFMSYAKTFKTLSKRNQISLKVELAQLFADIEARELVELSNKMM